MPNSKDLAANTAPKILIIGDGGTEKTRFLASAGVFVYDFDKGMDSTAGQDVEYVTFKDAPHGSKAFNKEEGIYPYGEAWPAFINHLNTVVWPQVEKGTFPFRGIGLDSLTTLSNISMNYVLKGNGKAAAAPEIQHWGQQLRLLETVMDQLTAWNIAVMVTAHIKRDDNIVTSITEYLPMVAGQLSGRVGIYFGEVYYTKRVGTGNDTRTVFITVAQGMYKQAKSRRNVPNDTAAKWSAIEPYLTGTKR